MKNILLLEPISAEALAVLQSQAIVFESTTPSSGVRFDAIVTRGRGRVDKTLLDACPDVVVVARVGVGLDNVDVEEASKRGIKVLNVPGCNADTVAEHALMLMLMLQRQVYSLIQGVKNDNWFIRNQYSGDEIRGKTLGIVGLGNIGMKVAQLAHAFGMKIIYWEKTPRDVPFQAVSFEDLLQSADLITLHLPLTTETKHLFNRIAFEKMQPHAFLINTARGEIVHQSDLLDALIQGEIAGFGGDVLETQPPFADEPLLALPNVLITPHSASLTQTTFKEMCMQSAKNVLKVLSNQPLEERYIANATVLLKV